MKVYIVFGSNHDSWCWDNVYKDKEKAKRRVKQLNNLYSFEDNLKLNNNDNDNLSSFIKAQKEAESINANTLSGNFNWKIIEKIIKEN